MLSVAAAVKLGADGTVEDARIVLGAVASRPIEAPDGGALARRRSLTDEAIERAATPPLNRRGRWTTPTFRCAWRKRVARDFVAYALRELRGDDMRAGPRRNCATAALVRLS